MQYDFHVLGEIEKWKERKKEPNQKVLQKVFYFATFIVPSTDIPSSSMILSYCTARKPLIARLARFDRLEERYDTWVHWRTGTYIYTRPEISMSQKSNSIAHYNWVEEQDDTSGVHRRTRTYIHMCSEFNMKRKSSLVASFSLRKWTEKRKDDT